MHGVCRSPRLGGGAVSATSWVIQRQLVALLVGVVFGLGLAVAGMTNPMKVLAFLDIAGDWDPSLMLVLGSAVAVSFVGFRVVLRRQRPVFDEGFALPTRSDLDRPLIAGAALFGVGWGLVGYCPGPAIASLGFGNAEALWFVPAMLLGMFLSRRFEQSGQVTGTASSATDSAANQAAA